MPLLLFVVLLVGVPLGLLCVVYAVWLVRDVREARAGFDPASLYES